MEHESWFIKYIHSQAKWMPAGIETTLTDGGTFSLQWNTFCSPKNIIYEVNILGFTIRTTIKDRHGEILVRILEYRFLLNSNESCHNSIHNDYVPLTEPEIWNHTSTHQVNLQKYTLSQSSMIVLSSLLCKWKRVKAKHQDIYHQNSLKW